MHTVLGGFGVQGQHAPEDGYILCHHGCLRRQESASQGLQGSAFCTDMDVPAEAAQADASPLNRTPGGAELPSPGTAWGEGASNSPQTEA